MIVCMVGDVRSYRDIDNISVYHLHYNNQEQQSSEMVMKRSKNYFFVKKLNEQKIEFSTHFLYFHLCRSLLAIRRCIVNFIIIRVMEGRVMEFND